MIRQVAQGGFGKVYVALDRTLKREVAIKRLLSKNEGPEAEAAEAAFQREALVLAAMQHPNIVQIFDFDQDEEGSFVVMEMLEGKTLKDALDKGALTWDDFTKLVHQSLDAISAAHNADILHRDLKPENIFLKRTVTGSWTVKVLDFGLAKLSAQPSKQTMDGKGNVFGSIYYMAPEQFRRQALDARTDLYALGCVYYQALTQRFPFYGETMAATMDAHLKHQVKPIDQRRKDIKPPMAAWLMRMLSPDREARPADAITARREFDEALAGRMPPRPVAAVATAAASPPRQQIPSSSASAASSARSSALSRSAAAPARSSPISSAARPAAPSPASSPLLSTSGGGSPRSRVAPDHTLSPRIKALVLGGLALAVGTVIFVNVRGGSQGKHTSTGAATSAAELPLPPTRSTPLPMEDRLVWRFQAGVESWHQGGDGTRARSTPQRGQRVHAWKSVSPEGNDLWCTPWDGQPDRAPIVEVANLHGQGTAHQCLYLSPTSGLEQRLDGPYFRLAPGNTSQGSNGATIVAVFRANASKDDRTMRVILLTSSTSKDTFSLHFSHQAGQYWARVHRSNAMVLPLVSPPAFAQRGAGGSWVVALVTWNSKTGKVSTAVCVPDGTIVHSQDATVPPGMPTLDNLHIGGCTLPPNSKLDAGEKMDGDLVEVAVYRQALDPPTQDKVLTALAECYFKAR